MPQCIPPDSPDAIWPFCPSPVPSVIFALLFGILTLVQLYQSISYRKPYCWVIVAATFFQASTYVLREVSVYQPTSLGLYSAWFVMILVAPLWINAFVYMVMARMVWCFLPEKRIMGIPAWRFGTLFVGLDILAFLVQVGGASMASGDDLTHDEIMRGLHIYMIGVGVQEVFILLFTGLLIRFHMLYLHMATTPYIPQRTSTRNLLNRIQSLDSPLHLLYVLYAVLALITVRIIFRLVEYSQGFESGIPTQEAYTFVFESLPMLVAVLLLSIVHPGRVMPGKENSIPSRKVRKQMMKDGLLGKKGCESDMEAGVALGTR